MSTSLTRQNVVNSVVNGSFDPRLPINGPIGSEIVNLRQVNYSVSFTIRVTIQSSTKWCVFSASVLLVGARHQPRLEEKKHGVAS